MGLCGSKPDGPSQSVSQTKPETTQRTAQKKSSPPKKTKEKAAKDEHSTKKKTTQKTAQGVGSKLSESSEKQNTDISPREAARLAAEKRLKEKNDALTQGDLGKKLAKERAKTYNSYRKDE
ncbi:hypothetical protein DAKH74_017570 [Maudiozyma humilis]|uniref:Uncharacterized protein n=1 Tax=Maudiozyma humilis TaxID=51915 RepID=A0AAV5RSK5_MAUHU|nr:hypothetical protein DAKH74_011060 [Kazachstania humilis]GMM55141.1 hypothetical protein DAKH74_017570 [Kazachstania humilis]